MASFDVVSLFTSVPIDWVGEIIRELWSVPCSGSVLDVEDAIDFVNFSLSSNCFVFDSTYYKTLSGTVMGSSHSVVIAEIMMQKIENYLLKKMGPCFIFWQRYIDNTFIVADPDDLDMANSICLRMNFTIEYWSVAIFGYPCSYRAWFTFSES